MEQPKPRKLVEAVGISQSYASMILSDDRTPPRSLAILIYRKTGWKHSSIADLTAEQMAVLEDVDPWTPRAERDAA